jgi:hypothetical protein
MIYILVAIIVIFLIWLVAFSNKLAPFQSGNQGAAGIIPTVVVSPTQVPSVTPGPSTMVSPTGVTTVSPTMSPAPTGQVSVTPTPTTP